MAGEKKKRRKKGKRDTYTLLSAALDFEAETLVAAFMLKEQSRKQKCMLGAKGAFRYTCSNLDLKAQKVKVKVLFFCVC